MMTLSEHNNMMFDRHYVVKQKPLAGVLCNTCKVEMYYPNPEITLVSCPPKQTVQCPQCNAIDYKVK